MYWPRFITGAVLVLITSIGGVYSPARAQVLAPQAAPTPDPLIFPSNNTPLQPSGSPGVGAAISDALNAQSADKITNSTASERTPVAFTNKDMASTYGTVMAWIMSLFAWLLGVAMLTLDYTVYYTVVNMGSYIHNLTAVGVAWRILRDIGNIALIFGFLAVGITTILNVGWYGGGKKFLPGLLIAAVFLNFSLFMTEAVIDAGNLFATQFYTQINGGSLPMADSSGRLTTAGGVALTTGNEGVSNKIMAQLGLQDIYGRALSNTAVFEGANTYLIGFMGTILFIIASFVIFSLAFILIARFIALVFLMILAPVGFAGLAIPQLEKSAKQWWSTLVEQTITAPILLLLLYIALAVITDAKFLTGFGSANATARWDGFINGTNLIGFAGLLLSFLVAMGLLLSVTYFSKKLGAFGGSWAMKTAGALSFGATAWAGRSSVGWLSQRGSEGWRKMGLSRVPILGRSVAGVLDRGAKASFDFRGTGALKNFPGGGIDAGVAQKGGFRDWEKTRTKEREEYAKSLGQTTGKFWGFGRASLGEEQKEKDAKARKDELTTKLRETENAHKNEMQEFLKAQKKDLQTYEDKVREAQLNVAKIEGNLRKGVAVPAGDVAAATKSLKDAREARDNKASEQSTQQKNLAQTQKGQIETQQKELKIQEQAVAKLERAPQEGYAKGLRLGIGYNKEGEYTGEARTLLGGAVGLFNPKRNTESAKSIIKFASKSKSEKDSDKLFELLEKASKKDEGGKEKEEKKEEKEGKKEGS